MGLGNVALFLEGHHVVADCGWGNVKLVTNDNSVGSNRLRSLDEVFDYGL